MEIPARRTGSGWTVLSPSGRIDANTSPDLDRALGAQVADGARVAVDLSAVAFLSSAGLRALLTAVKALGARGGALAVLAPRPNVREVLEVSGFSSILTVHASEADLGAAGPS